MDYGKKIKIEEQKKKEIELEAYWKEDIWELEKCPAYEGIEVGKRNALKTVRFDGTTNEMLKNEAKYFLYKKIVEEENTPQGIFGHYGTVTNFILHFMEKHFPKVNSFIEIEKEQLLMYYRTYCVENGKRLTKIGKYDQKQRRGIPTTYNKSTEYLTVFNQFYNYYLELYDEREETEKDVWDVRKLDTVYNNTSTSYYRMDFTKIHENFRELAKKYVKLRVISQESLTWSTATNWVRGIENFFYFYNSKYPEKKDLKELKRNDIEEYLNYIRTKKTVKGVLPTQDAIKREIMAVESFLNFIQKLDWEEAPRKPVSKLIIMQDKPKKKKVKAENIKYVPDDIWEQVVQNIDKLDKKYIPMVLLLEATGFRISDICQLKLDCLEEKKDGWWIKGDQMKVKEKDHRVPVSKEIASVVLAQQKVIKEISNEENNPSNYLFPTLEGKRKGMPITKTALVGNLRKLANECQIKDKKGETYYFNGHAFRHRYAVNLINNGMNLLHVQKLMAHASPEMTLIYAQIHDNTLRKEWEKARENGAVRLDTAGKIISANLEEQVEENGLELEWIRHNLDSVRLDHGFCIKSPKVSCEFLEQVVEPPCIKNNCRSFHVDQTFVDYYNEQINKMEQDLEIYKKTGRTRSIELTEKKKARYKEIRDSLLEEGMKMGMSKAKREYTEEERKGVK